MKLNKTNSHVVDLLFTLALFCLFAVSSLVMVRIGVGVYRNTVDSMTQNYSLRTSLAYVAEKVRQNDTSAGVRIGELEGCEALVLDQEIDGAVYETYIYYYSGGLHELFVRQGAQAGPEQGQTIVEVSSFAMEETDGLFTFSCTDADGRTESIKAYVRSR